METGGIGGKRVKWILKSDSSCTIVSSILKTQHKHAMSAQPPQRQWKWFVMELIVFVVTFGFFVFSMFASDVHWKFPWNYQIYSLQKVAGRASAWIWPENFCSHTVSDHKECKNSLFHGGADSNKLSITRIQAIKYVSGCYGNREEGDLRMPHAHEMRMETATPYENSTETNMWYDTVHYAWSQDKQKYAFVKTLLLNLWQEQEDPMLHQSMPSNALYDRSLCSCLDEYEARSFAYSETVLIRDALKLNAQSFIDNFNANDSLQKQVWTWLVYLHETGMHMNTGLATEFYSLIPILEQSTGFRTFANATANDVKNMTRHSSTVQSMLMNLIDNVKLSNIQRDLLRTTPFARLDGMTEHAVYDFCSVTSASPYTIKYEGGADIWLMLFIGQFLLLLSCVYSFEQPFIRSHLFGQYGPMAFLDTEKADHAAQHAHHASHTTPHDNSKHPEHDDDQRKLELFIEGKTQFFLSIFRIVMIIALIIIALQMSTSRRNNDKWSIDDRHDPADSSTSSVFSNPNNSLTFTTFVTCVLLVVLFLCEFFYAYYHYNYKIRCCYTGTLSETVASDLLKIVCRDICVIIALYVLSVAVIMQTGAKEVTFLKTVSSLVLIVAFLQHVSNVFNYALDILGAWLQAHQQSEKKHTGHNLFSALHDASSSAAGRMHAIDLNKMSEVIVRFCWFRAAVIGLVILTAVLIFTMARPTQVPSSMYYYALQMLVYCITLVLVLVGFDFFYETISIGSSSKNYTSAREMKHSVHTYIVCLFVLFSNLLHNLTYY